MPHKDYAVRLAYMREYNRARRKEAIARMNQWRKDHPDRQRVVSMVNRANMSAKRYGLAGRISQKHVDALPKVCIYCGSKERLSIEHLMPFRRGGTNDPTNIAIACMPCNRAKGYLTEAEYRDELARKREAAA